jgi:hypothetical protein
MKTIEVTNDEWEAINLFRATKQAVEKLEEIHIETKLVGGQHTYDEALKLQDDGWRLPTIFELILIQKQAELGDDNREGAYWSSSTNANDSSNAWNVYFNNGNAYRNYKDNYRYVRLVRGGQDFDHLRSVSREEVEVFKKTGTLPSWHPPLDKSMAIEPPKPTLYSGYTEEQIQIIIDGGYLVTGSVHPDSTECSWPDNQFYKIETFRKDWKDPFHIVDKLTRFRYIRLVREVGHIQPWFGGEYDGSPDDIVTTYDGERWLGGRAGWDQRTWPDVTKYILVEKSNETLKNRSTDMAPAT